MGSGFYKSYKNYDPSESLSIKSEIDYEREILMKINPTPGVGTYRITQ